MGLTRTHKYGILAAGGAGVAAIIGKDVLLGLFMASSTPLSEETSQVDAEQSQQMKDAIEDAVEQSFGRRMATAEDYEIAAIGKLMYESKRCTAQIVDIPGYFTDVPGTLLTTAAHCTFGKDPEKFNFSTTYATANGEETEFLLESSADNPALVWTNPGYDPDLGDKKKLQPDDNAIIFFPHRRPPAAITPIKQRVFAHHMADYNIAALGALHASAAGFSRDLPDGKSIDEECEASQPLNGGLVTTTCKINYGASGGSLLVRNLFGELESLAVLAGGTVKDGEIDVTADNFRSYYAPFYHHQLADVPFLNKVDQCVMIMEPDGGNLRMHADIGSDTVGDAMPQSSVVRVRDTLDWERAEIGDPNVWLEVMETEDGRDGYIRSDLVAEVNCP